MDLNYDQFNGDALIFKYNLDEYGNPISIKVDKEEKQVSVHGTIQLEYLPDEYNRVVILNEDNTQMTEVFNRDEIKPNTYYVDYNNGVVYLDKFQFGKTKIYNYYKKGLQLIGCSRIYDEHDVSGKHVVLTLQEIIDAGREALRFLLDIGDAKKVIELLESLIAEGKLTITNLENKKNECIQSINNAISQATQDKNEIVQEIQDNIQQAKDEVVNVAGNKEVIIRASDWALNIDVYEKEISHNLNSENLHVTAKNSDTKEAVTIGYKIINKSTILLKSDEAINMSVVLSASYYHATQTISDSIAEEVVKARKGEVDLKTKIDSIDEQLDNIENRFEEFNIRDYCENILPTNHYKITNRILELEYVNGKLKVPSGVYKCDFEIIFNGSMVVEGDGFTSCIISTINGIDKYLFKFNNQSAKHCKVKDLFISGNTGTLANSNGIYTCNNAWFRLEDTRIDGFVGSGITFENVYLGNVINSHIMGCDIGINIKPFASLTIQNTEITYNKVGIYDIGGGVTRINGGYIEQNGQGNISTNEQLMGGLYKNGGTLFMNGMYVEDNGSYSRRDNDKIGKNGNLHSFYDFDIFLENMNGGCVVDGISTNLNPGGIHLKNSCNCEFKNIKVYTKGYRSLFSPIMWADENSFDNKIDYTPYFEDGNNVYPFMILGNKFKNKNEYINDDNLITTNNTNKISPYKPIAKDGYSSEWSVTADKTSGNAPIYGSGVGTVWTYNTPVLKQNYITGVKNTDIHTLKFLCKCKSTTKLSPLFNGDIFDFGLYGQGEKITTAQIDFFGSASKLGLVVDIQGQDGDSPIFYNVQYCKNLYHSNFSYVNE